MFDTHLEKNLIINNRELKYQGIFRPGELFAAINRALEDKAYVKREKKTEQLVTEHGKGVYVELRPYKMLTHYLTLMIKIKITLDDLEEVTAEGRGEKAVFQQGKVLILFDAWVLTDYERRWGMKPWFYFWKGLVNKYIYTFPLEGGAGGQVSGDTAYIYGKIKQLLHSYKPVEQKFIPEVEVRKKVEGEMGKEVW